MEQRDDLHDIKLVLAGNTHAFAALVDRYKDMVFALAHKLLRNREEAEEVAQDTFVKAYRSLRSFKSDSKFSTWLYKIAYNTGLDRIRKLKRSAPLISIDEHTEHRVTELSNIFEVITGRERRKMVQDCLDMLPGEENFLLTLFYFEEQSIEEISKIIGISTGNVKIRLHRSRKKLAAILEEQLEPEILKYHESEQG